MVRAKVLRVLFIHIDRVPADVLVVVIVGVTGIVVVVVIVAVSVAVVISAVVIAAVPRRISVVSAPVIDDRSAVPPTVPTAITPAATPASPAHHRTNCDPSAEPNNARGSHVASTIPRSRIGGSIDHRGVVLWNIDHLWVRRLNYNHLWGLLNHSHLWRGFQIARRFGLRA